MMDSDFGNRLRRLRQDKEMTMKDVAKLIGCTTAYVWALEKRPGQRPTADRVQALARVLGVSMGELMGEPPVPIVIGTMSAVEGGDGSAGMATLSGADEAFIRGYISARPEDKQLLQDVLQSVQRIRPGNQS